MITKPGVYTLDNATYHADPVEGGSLSSSGARALLASPARFHYERKNGRPEKRAFDFGHAAHTLVLGAGMQIVEVEADSFRTKDAQAQRDDAYAAGKTPLLSAEYEIVQAMAVALAQHPVARALFTAAGGTPEQSLIWQDPSGVWRRAMLDWFPGLTADRLIVPDYKTARSADPERFAKSAADYGYHQQAAWYLDGITALGIAEDPAFVFVVQEKEPPYLVSVVELDATALRIGRALNRQAIDLYAECTESGVWPGYGDDVHLTALPRWYETRMLEEMFV